MTYKDKLKILGAAAAELHSKGAPTSYMHKTWKNPTGYPVTINHKRRMKRLMNSTGLSPIKAAHLYVERNAKPKTK